MHVKVGRVQEKNRFLARSGEVENGNDSRNNGSCLEAF